MSRVSIHLNFDGQAEAAFNFYKSVFSTEFIGQISRFSQAPPQKDQPPLAQSDKNLIMHIELPILGGQVLMGADVPKSMGVKLNPGNNFSIMLEPDTKPETDKLFNKLSEEGKIEMPLDDMFWGAYFGSCVDKYGIKWMINCYTKKN